MSIINSTALPKSVQPHKYLHMAANCNGFARMEAELAMARYVGLTPEMNRIATRVERDLKVLLEMAEKYNRDND